MKCSKPKAADGAVREQQPSKKEPQVTRNRPASLSLTTLGPKEQIDGAAVRQ